MAFANENLLSGHGPQIPIIVVPQGGSPVKEFTLINTQTPDVLVDCVSLLSLQDDAEYTDWEDTGGYVKLTAREYFNDNEALIDCVTDEVDATKGKFSVRVATTLDTDPGIYIMQVGLYSRNDELVLINNGYLEVEASFDAIQKHRQVSIPMMRRLIRDASPRGNRIIEECEFTYEELMDALIMAVDDFNFHAPLISAKFTLKDFPWPMFLMGYGAVSNLLRTAAVWYARNDLRVQATGVGIDDMGKAEVYMALADKYKAEWERFVTTVKRQMNVNAGWGRVKSRSYPASFRFGRYHP